MAEKRKVYRKVDASTLEQVLFETSAEQVTFDGSTAALSSTNVQDAIEAVAALAKSSGVTGVKGDKESAYRTGNVNLTAANIGALADSTKYGATLDLAYASSTGVITATLKDQSGATLSTKTVDLPLELLVESGTVETCTVANKPVSGYKVGDKYIDLVLANGSHIYILASDLVDQVSISDSGTGNAITGLTVSGNTITATKGKTFVETSRTINEKPLSSNITLNASDVGALASDGTAVAAKRLETSRTISITGAATGSTNFNGSGNATINITLANSGVTAGAYSVVGVNEKGLVTAGSQLIKWREFTTQIDTDVAIGGLIFELQS